MKNLSKLKAGLIPAFLLILGFFIFTPITQAALLNRVEIGSKSYFLLGFNYGWHQYNYDFGADQYSNLLFYKDKVSTQLTDLKSSGTHVTRWYIFNDTKNYPLFGSDGLVLPLPNSFYQNFDQALELAKQNNIYLVPQLLDTTLTEIANPASAHKTIITNPAVRQSYLDNVLKPLLQRYGTNSQIVAWSIINEPDWSTIGAHPDDNHHHISLLTMQDFIKLNSQYIHSFATQKATIEAGGLPWLYNWVNLGLDIYFVHWYDWIDQEPCYPDGRACPIHLTSATQIPNKATGGVGFDKPIVVSEFPTGDTQKTLDQSLTSFYNLGYAGSLAWCYEANNPDGFCNYSENKGVMKTFETNHLYEVNISNDLSTSPMPSVVPTPSLIPSPSPVSIKTLSKNGIDYSSRGGTAKCWSKSGTSLISCSTPSFANYTFKLPISSNSVTVSVESSNFDLDITPFVKTHNIDILVDGVKKGTIANLTTAFANHQIGQLNIGALSKGTHTIRWVWTNDYYAGNIDSNIAVHKVSVSY